MEVHGVDPRYASGEIGRPAYRVNFWGPVGAPVGDEDATVSDEYLLTGAADVREVLAWAESQAGGRQVVVYAVHPSFGPGHTLLWLAGLNRTRA